MKIAVDAMGGDYAPEEIVLGAIEASKHMITMSSWSVKGKALFIPSSMPMEKQRSRI